MSFKHLSQRFLPALETEMRNVVSHAYSPESLELHKMLTYHLGWEEDGSGSHTRGKRIRPLLLLITTEAARGHWEDALPAAAAVEILHNFSLLHDDIEDNSPMRRGRQTVWKKWGVPQAINAGDAMFTLAYFALLGLKDTVAPKIVLQANKVFNQSCLRLTQGQYQDISYENRPTTTLNEYWSMIEGKTATLLATCSELGALIANTNTETRTAYQRFGCNLGLAFQVQDDMLGIWGDAITTGKSTDSDLVSGKKSLPILYGLEQNGPFAKRWRAGSLSPDEVEMMAKQLETEGAKDYTKKMVHDLTQKALHSLDNANPQGEAGEALIDLASRLLSRKA